MRFLPAVLLAGALLRGDVRNCTCDPASATSLAQRECGLCREAEKHPPHEAPFFVKDINPNKPDRWLALPRAHAHHFGDLTAVERTALWTAAIAKGKQLWGAEWGLAANSDIKRSQCHLHIHIGKLLDGSETANFTVARTPTEIPVPADGGGIWVHPVDGKLHVHLGEDAPETLLMR